MVNQMDVLLLGGSGFLSQAFLGELIKHKDYDVDTLTRYGIYNNHVRNDFRTDRLDVVKIKDIISKNAYDFIFDFSSYSFCDVKNIIENLSLEKLKSYVYCSSISVYSKTEKIINESSLCDASLFEGQYGINKLSNEQYILQKHEMSQFPFIIVRPTYIYGPANNVHRENYYFQRALNNKNIFLPQNDIHLQFIYLSDLVKIFIHLLDKPALSNNIFNCASEKKLSLHKIIEKIMRITNSKSKIYYYDEAQTHAKVSSFRLLPYHDQSFQISIDKMKKLNLPIPQTFLNDGFKNIYHEIKMNGIQTSQPLLSSVDRFYEKGYIYVT